ncbi:MAG: hypothetical protein Greene041614_322 [Parcubacteria group bacterium Greene0416_14]|nr:MAG: hypothetical protein Greene041614_322 [Parcubacteria group bacterium Greene0416_14]
MHLLSSFALSKLQSLRGQLPKLDKKINLCCKFSPEINLSLLERRIKCGLCTSSLFAQYFSFSAGIFQEKTSSNALEIFVGRGSKTTA